MNNRGNISNVRDILTPSLYSTLKNELKRKGESSMLWSCHAFDRRPRIIAMNAIKIPAYGTFHEYHQITVQFISKQVKKAFYPHFNHEWIRISFDSISMCFSFPFLAHFLS